jgi:hypothetical protein
LGRATNPQRRASVRTTGVNARARANDTAGGIRLEKLTGNIVGDDKADELESYSIKAAKASQKILPHSLPSGMATSAY